LKVRGVFDACLSLNARRIWERFLRSVRWAFILCSDRSGYGSEGVQVLDVECYFLVCFHRHMLNFAPVAFRGLQIRDLLVAVAATKLCTG